MSNCNSYKVKRVYSAETAQLKSVSTDTTVGTLSVSPGSKYALDAEAWAVGQRLGVDVPETDETYQNNAKYYAEKAEEAAESFVPDKNFAYEQTTASDTWTIEHNLDKYPSVTVVDSGGTEVLGDVQHVDTNNVIITFSAAFSGYAYFN